MKETDINKWATLMIDKIRQMSAGEWQKPWFTPRTGLPQNISGSQWESMLRGRGTVLNPAKQKMLFSIRKQPSGYGVRIADISGKISSSVQREL
ncbi:ArdC family protein [Phocaeicola vulgatus]|jgi:hypothetical protein|uniref:ArdC-like ssDNA-binding domain-containing protein n=1 Tax=Phocaeicola vulgatus TaxID=821 RepID=UPI001F3EEF6E|nr:ArdC-like ssDNA-binding domain-containing protein [Phocaeicola vulgatus]MCG0173948.1 ArdC family protein [Phocaeicola vulgatus]